MLRRSLWRGLALIAGLSSRLLALGRKTPLLACSTSLHAERELWGRGFTHVIGVDEAGRGPLAGSVYAAAVCIPVGWLAQIEVDDSKRLSEKKRDDIYQRIVADSAIKFAVASVDSQRIDEVNILEASMEAMSEAVRRLCEMHSFPLDQSYVLVDGNRAPKLPLKSKSIVGGDASVYSIAMASIIAKVSRDQSMRDYDKVFPQYGFAKHKGYPTKEHRYALHKHGPCAIHRLSFKPLKGRAATPPIDLESSEVE